MHHAPAAVETAATIPSTVPDMAELPSAPASPPVQTGPLPTQPATGAGCRSALAGSTLGPTWLAVCEAAERAPEARSRMGRVARALARAVGIR